ncbi:MAG: GNAT family N-acetyltransferase [Chitinophagaceae bacterium]|nr:GNAT family N-acetyltransferase [Polaromonas sp.]
MNLPTKISPNSVLAGHAAFRIQTGSWQQLGADAAMVRCDVFIKEQGIPIDQEWDDADHTALHAVAFNPLGQALATGRLLVNTAKPAQSSKIGRMAVLQAERGTGLGQAILQTLLDAAFDRGDREITLHAQCSAQGFYLRMGFMPRGEVFDEVGMAHIEMFRLCPPVTEPATVNSLPCANFSAI